MAPKSNSSSTLWHTHLDNDRLENLKWQQWDGLLTSSTLDHNTNAEKPRSRRCTHLHGASWVTWAVFTHTSYHHQLFLGSGSVHVTLDHSTHTQNHTCISLSSGCVCLPHLLYNFVYTLSPDCQEVVPTSFALHRANVHLGGKGWSIPRAIKECFN